MVKDVDAQKTFEPLRRVATRLGLPPSWHRGEVTAGRVPALRVGEKILLNPDAVERALLERVQNDASPEGGANAG